MNKKKNIILISIACITIVLLCAFLFFSKSKKVNILENTKEGLVYYDENGNVLKNKLKEIDKNLYYFNEKGFAVKDTLKEVNKDLYFFDKDSKAIKDTLKDYENSKYYFDKDSKALKNSLKQISNDLYYFGEDFKAVKNKWVKEFYFGENFKMLKDTTTPDGIKLDKDGKKIKEEEKEEKISKNENKKKFEVVESKKDNEVKKQIQKQQQKKTRIRRTLTVPEMMCEGCEHELIGLFSQRGINAVANYTTKTVTVTTDKQISDSELVGILTSNGWKVTSIR